MIALFPYPPPPAPPYLSELLEQIRVTGEQIQELRREATVLLFLSENE